MTAETEIHGTLTASPLSDVLSSLETQAVTGVLNLAGGGEIWLSDGRTYLVNSPTAPALSSVLFAADVGSLEEIETLLAAVDPSSTVLEKLFASHPDSTSSVQRLTHEHNLNGLFEMLVPSDQDYTFRPGEVHALGSRFAESTSDLLAKALERMDTWRKIAARIPSTNAVFSLVHELPGRAQERTFTADEWQYVSHLNGRVSVSQVVTETGQSAFRVTSALYRLLLEGLIEEEPSS